LEAPQYTRPADFDGLKVPDVLLSGNHKLISKWQREMQLKVTLEKRPDLIEKAVLTKEDKEFLKKLQNK
jgi:tRNA (guanine37-N1)-methyltransferase